MKVSCQLHTAHPKCVSVSFWNRAAPHMKVCPGQELKAQGCLGLAGAGSTRVRAGFGVTGFSFWKPKAPLTPSVIWRHPRRDLFKDAFRPWFRKAPENCFCAQCSVCLCGILKNRLHWNGLSKDVVCANTGSLWTLWMWFVPTLAALLLPIPHTGSLPSSGSLSHF